MKKFNRNIINLGLFAAFGASVMILFFAIDTKEWNTVTACLAVITAIFATYNSQRNMWKQEDDMEPNLEIYLDAKSRHGATQIVIENLGQSSAYNIYIEWKEPLYDSDKKEVHFNLNENEKIEIPVINKGQIFRRYVNTTVDIYQESRKKNNQVLFNGTLYYQMKSKTRFLEKKEFILSVDNYLVIMDFETEKDKFLYDNQKMSQKLENIDNSINKLIKKLNNRKKAIN